MTPEQIIGALVAVFAIVVAVMTGALKNRGKQVQKATVEVAQAKREVEHLKAEREIEKKDNDEIAKAITEALRGTGGSADDDGDPSRGG